MSVIVQSTWSVSLQSSTRGDLLVPRTVPALSWLLRPQDMCATNSRSWTELVMILYMWIVSVVIILRRLAEMLARAASSLNRLAQRQTAVECHRSAASFVQQCLCCFFWLKDRRLSACLNCCMLKCDCHYLSRMLSLQLKNVCLILTQKPRCCSKKLRLACSFFGSNILCCWVICVVQLQYVRKCWLYFRNKLFLTCWKLFCWN